MLRFFLRPALYRQSLSLNPFLDITPHFIGPTSQELTNFIKLVRDFEQPQLKNHLHSTNNNFQIKFKLDEYKPEEISVKVSGKNTITIEGKHEEEGHFSKQFLRQYVLPEGHDIDQIESRLSPEGVLTIVAPRIQQEEPERIIPITREETPSIEDNTTTK